MVRSTGFIVFLFLHFLCRIRSHIPDVVIGGITSVFRLCPSLHSLGKRLPSIVRLLHKYYGTVRLLQRVHVCRTAYWPSRTGVSCFISVHFEFQFPLHAGGVDDHSGRFESIGSAARICNFHLPRKNYNVLPAGQQEALTATRGGAWCSLISLLRQAIEKYQASASLCFSMRKISSPARMDT